MNLTLPMASSSDAVQMSSVDAHVLTTALRFLNNGLTRMESRLKDGYSVILHTQLC